MCLWRFFFFLFVFGHIVTLNWGTEARAKDGLHKRKDKIKRGHTKTVDQIMRSHYELIDMVGEQRQKTLPLHVSLAVGLLVRVRNILCLHIISYIVWQKRWCWAGISLLSDFYKPFENGCSTWIVPEFYSPISFRLASDRRLFVYSNRTVASIVWPKSQFTWCNLWNKLDAVNSQKENYEQQR